MTDLLDKVLAQGGTFTAEEVRKLLTLRDAVKELPAKVEVSTLPPPAKSNSPTCRKTWIMRSKARKHHLSIFPGAKHHECRHAPGHDGQCMCICGFIAKDDGDRYVVARTRAIIPNAVQAARQEEPAPVKLTPEAAGERDAKKANGRKLVSDAKKIVPCPHCQHPCVGNVGLAAHIMQRHPEFGTEGQKRAHKVHVARAAAAKGKPFGSVKKVPTAYETIVLDNIEQTVLAEVTRFGTAGCTVREAARAASIMTQKAESILERLVLNGVVRVEFHAGAPPTYSRRNK